MAITTTTLDLVSQAPPTNTTTTTRSSPSTSLGEVETTVNIPERSHQNDQEQEQENEQEQKQEQEQEQENELLIRNLIQEKEALLIQCHDASEYLDDVKLQLQLTKESLTISEHALNEQTSELTAFREANVDVKEVKRLRLELQGSICY